MGSLIRTWMLRLLGKDENTDVNQFKYLMEWANRIASTKNEEGLRDLIKIVLRPVQAKHMRDAYLKSAHGAPEPLWWPNSMSLFGYSEVLKSNILSYVSQNCVVKDVKEAEELNLASDVLLPTVWHPSSLVNTLGMIGPGLPAKEFEPSTNHCVTYMHPLGIGWVNGGNHSISQAIVRGQGTLVPTEFIDVTSLIQAIRYDGSHWRCIGSGKQLGTPRYPEFGWVWEIGRHLVTLSSTKKPL